MTRRGSGEASEKTSGIRGGRETVGDGATSRALEAFQFGDISNA